VRRGRLRDIIYGVAGKYVSMKEDVREEWRRECGGSRAYCCSVLIHSVMFPQNGN